MSRWLKLTLALVLAFASLPAFHSPAQAGTLCDFSGTHSKGAQYCIKMPPAGAWNGGLVVFAHGYLPVTAPVGIPWSQMYLADGSYLPDVINAQGFAFATTSYSFNGLAVVRGEVDVLDLLDVFNTLVGAPSKSYLVGASEGGLLTTLEIERHPGVFSGGMSLCGPIGDFKQQINYWGNMRVAFDYYFPGILPPSAVDIPQSVIDNWDAVYSPAIGLALATANPPTKIATLLAVTGAPIDPAVPGTTLSTIGGVLWYNVFATNNGIDVLGGQPFDNHATTYLDPGLDLAAPRYTADPKAIKTINQKYETSGRLQKPFVTMHTTGDPIVPFWHDTLYVQKVLANNKGAPYLNIPVERYGHCNFTTQEMLTGFSWLVTHSQ